MSKFRWRLSTIAFALAFVTTARAEAETTDAAQSVDEVKREAATAFWSGKQAYDAGDFARAREQFQRAYQLTKDPELLYDLGQTYRQMGECAPARQAYQQFLQAAPTSPLAARATRHVARLDAACPSSRSPEDDSGGTPALAEQRRPETHARPDPPRAVAVEPGRPWRVWTVVTLAAGLAAGGVAAGLEIYNQQRYHEWSERNRSLARGTAGETPTDWVARQQANDRLGGSIDAMDRTALLVGLGGAVLVAASAALYLARPGESSGPPRASAIELRPTTMGTKSAGIAFAGSF
jgi:tetratricopeptide (TPR) repeat protein